MNPAFWQDCSPVKIGQTFKSGGDTFEVLRFITNSNGDLAMIACTMERTGSHEHGVFPSSLSRFNPDDSNKEDPR